ncbi:MAG: hypothetical protein AAFQ37_05915 [Bacteroidota bacterium]
MKHFLLFSLLCVSSILVAQDPADIFHVTLEVDSVDEVSLDVYPGDSLRVEPWAGNHLLIETSVMLHNGKQNVLKFFREKGRWNLQDELTGKSLRLTSVDKERRKVETDKGLTEEEVTVVVYLPEAFEKAGNSVWRRKQD